MNWIVETISNRRDDILRSVGELAGLEWGTDAPMREEVLKQAELTLELLPGVLSGGPKAELLGHWESVGRFDAERETALAEIPNIPEMLKKSIWSMVAGEVEAGNTTLKEIVDSMMGVEAILEECRLATVRSYLGSRDVEISARAERMEALYSLTEILSTESDIFQMYRDIVDKVSGITGIERCSLLIEGEHGLEPVASNFVEAFNMLKSLSPEQLGALSAAVSSGGPVVLDSRQDGFPRRLEEVLEAYGTTAVLLLPLKSGERDLGVMLLDDGDGVDFGGEQVEMAVATANQAAIAVEKSGILQEMENRLKHMAAIGVVARTLPSFLDQKEQLGSLLEMGMAIARADRGAIFLMEEMFGQLKLAASTGTDGFGEEGFLPLAGGWVAEIGETLLLDATAPDPRFPSLDMGDVVWCIVSPMMVREKSIGVIGVATADACERYGDDDVEMFANFASQAAMSIENTQLYERLQDTYLGAIGSLAAAIEARDPYTVGHSARVTQYAVAIAESMALPPDEVEELRMAGLLHDLGKIGVPDSILNKPGRLSEEEYSAIKMHPALSMRIIEPLPHLGNIIPIIYHHHEHFDGSGYVDGKAGEKIPLGARIIAVADSFEAMTSDRPYRAALSRGEAMAELKRNSGSQFDPEVVEHFLKLLVETTAVE